MCVLFSRALAVVGAARGGVVVVCVVSFRVHQSNHMVRRCMCTVGDVFFSNLFIFFLGSNSPSNVQNSFLSTERMGRVGGGRSVYN
jgi:hypothetical protein